MDYHRHSEIGGVKPAPQSFGLLGLFVENHPLF